MIKYMVITGAEFLKLAWDKMNEMRFGGGMVTFLEVENKEKLLSFMLYIAWQSAPYTHAQIE